MEAIAEQAGFERSAHDAYRERRTPRDPTWLADIRRGGLKRLAQIGFPTVHDEDWKYTNVAPILKVPFVEGRRETPWRAPHPGPLSPGEGIQFVFINGRFAPDLSSRGHRADGPDVASLAEVLATRPEWAEPHLARIARKGNGFASLNEAFLDDGAFVRIPAKTAVAEPIQLVFLSEPDFGPTVSHPRNLVIAEAGSEAAIVETYIGTAGELYFTNSVTEVHLADGAILDLYKLERESTAAFHVATMEVRQGRDSRFRSHSISLGGALVRNDLNVRLDAEGADCTLNGLFVGSGTQHLDNHTLIDH
ncbi:MAG TPA: SufD family Fe-S cluster assembly protein, partial [Thermoanaerobaculia bacterium]